ncbi:MAG: class I SAM-dependent methyltransferase [Actinobacteria bacterium]|nr:class I SAM-dependent methyltransferase [Actinomycetota bacterium]
MTGGGSSIPEVQRLLTVLAAGRRVAEAGTAFGAGAEAMAKTARSVVTVERDPERAAVAAARLERLENVELLVGDWLELLPPLGPYGLVFHDAGNFKRAPYELGDAVLGLLEPGGLLVLDDMAPRSAGVRSAPRVGVGSPAARGRRNPDDTRGRGARDRSRLLTRLQRHSPQAPRRTTSCASTS